MFCPLSKQNAEYMTRQIFDLSDKLENSETALGRAGLFGLDPQEKKTEDKLSRVTRDSCKTTMEALHGLMAQVVKDRLFNQIPQAQSQTKDSQSTSQAQA